MAKMKRKTEHILKILLLTCSALLPFLYSLEGDFIFDDSAAVEKNPDVTTNPVKDAFFHDFWGADLKSNLSHKSYRPLTILSFKLDYHMSDHKLYPAKFKDSNVKSHSVSCIFAHFFFKAVAFKAGYTDRHASELALLSSLLFAVHPVHVEAVSAIVGRADILSSSAFFLTYLLYDIAACTSKHMFLFLALVFSVCSMLFKETGITVLGLLMVYEFVLNTKTKLKISDLPLNSWRRLTLLAISIVIILSGRWYIMGWSSPEFKEIDNPAMFSKDIFTKIATTLYIYVLNCLLLIWPRWLCFDWSMGCVPLVRSPLDPRLLGILPVAYFGFRLLRYLTTSKVKPRVWVDALTALTANQRIAAMAVSLSVISFLPASNLFFTVGFVVAERVLYLPSAGYCLLVGLGLKKLMVTRWVRWILLPLYVLLLLLNAMQCHLRSLDWTSQYRLFASGLDVCPLNAKVHYNVAKAADANHETSLAQERYEEAIRLYPEYYQAMNNLANLLKDMKQYDRAEGLLRRALEINPNFPAAWMNLGIVLAATDLPLDAGAAYRRALRLRRAYPDCYYNLGLLHLSAGETERALAAWRSAVELAPQHVPAWTNLFALLANKDDTARALELLPAALMALPHAAPVRLAAGGALARAGRFSEAEPHFLEALDLLGDRAEALHYTNFGVLYHRWKKYELAEKMYRKALKIDPNYESAKRNMESLKRIKSLPP